MNKYALMILSVLITSVMADNDPKPSKYSLVTSAKYSNYIGFSGGFITASGISIRKWFGDKNGVQLNFLPYYTENTFPENGYDYYPYRDSGFSNEGFVSIGLTYLRSVVEAKYIRFLSYIGSNAYITYDKYDYYESEIYYNQTSSSSIHHYSGEEMKTTICGGGGFGLEFYVWRLAFHIMGGLRGKYAIQDDLKGILPSIEGGVHFRL